METGRRTSEADRPKGAGDENGPAGTGHLPAPDGSEDETQRTDVPAAGPAAGGRPSAFTGWRRSWNGSGWGKWERYAQFEPTPTTPTSGDAIAAFDAAV